MNKTKKPLGRMNAKELAEATRTYDRPFGGWDEFGPLTAQDRKLHAQARKRGRPRIGEGAAKIRISIESGLLRHVDRYAKRHGVTRSQLFAAWARQQLEKTRAAG